MLNSRNLCTFFAFSVILYVANKQAVSAATATCNPPPLPANSNFVPSPDCSGTYTTTTQHCSCWGHCGYICEPRDTGTCQPQFANGPANMPPGFTWISSPGCTFGQRPSEVLIGTNGDTNRCTCYAFCGYQCDPNGSVGAPA